MPKSEYLMIKWIHSPLYKRIVVMTAKGKQKEINKGGDEDFLFILNEYGEQGWKIDKTLQFGDGGNFMILAILSKPIELN